MSKVEFRGRGYAKAVMTGLGLEPRLRQAMHLAGFDPLRVTLAVKTGGDRVYFETITVTDRDGDFDVAKKAAEWLSKAIVAAGCDKWVENADVAQPPLPRSCVPYTLRDGRKHHRCGVELFVRFSGDLRR